MLIRFTLHGGLMLLCMLVVLPIFPFVSSDELFGFVDGGLQTFLQIDRAVDLMIPALFMSILVGSVAIARIYRMHLTLGLSLLSLVADILMLPLAMSVLKIGHEQEWQDVRLISNLITAVFLGLSAYVVVIFQGGTIATLHLIWQERSDLTRQVVHISWSIVLLGITILVLGSDWLLATMHLKQARLFKKKLPVKLHPGSTWPDTSRSYGKLKFIK